MSFVSIRALVDDDWEKYRDIRLRSLKQDPESFGSTYEREANFTAEQWIERLDLKARNSAALPLVAEQDSHAIGLVCGIVHEAGDDAAVIYQMWVAKEYRGQGIGRLLIEEIIRWASELNISTLKLGVITANTAAVRLYESIGFVATGELELLKPGSQLRVQNMSFTLKKTRTRNADQ